MDFKGQHLVVTGGSSGIGLATAQRFGAAGGRVTIVGRDTQRLAQAAESIGAGVRTLSADVTDESILRGLFKSIGAFNHLVTAAGPAPNDGPFEAIDFRNARALFEGKFWSQLMCARYALGQMSQPGSITFIGGSLSRKAMPGAPIFGAIDGALETVARILAIECAPIRVNAIAPGIIDTPMLGHYGPQVRARVLERAAGETLVQRYGMPGDVAKAIVHVIDNTFVNGTVMDVDGGMVADVRRRGGEPPGTGSAP
ncbi:MAG: SDR family oxidoreductase [Gammaproteobacteria bacterium]